MHRPNLKTKACQDFFESSTLQLLKNWTGEEKNGGFGEWQRTREKAVNIYLVGSCPLGVSLGA